MEFDNNKKRLFLKNMIFHYFTSSLIIRGSNEWQRGLQKIENIIEHLHVSKLMNFPTKASQYYI